MLEPVAQLFLPFSGRKLLDTSPQFPEREHADVQRLIGNLLEPIRHSLCGLRTRQLGDDIGIDQVAHNRTLRGELRSRVKSISTAFSGELRMKSTNRVAGFLSRR